jgi:uncharacterized protein
MMAVILAGCGSRQDIHDFALRDLTLPNGKSIRVEALRTPVDMARGAMFRDSLPPDRGLLYEYAKAGTYGFWMYQTRMPLDTIWMDSNRRVVEVVENMPPCPSASAKECPHFGGSRQSQFVLQVAAGQASRNAVQVGSVLSF